MARRRFLVDSICESTAELRGDEAHHLARVLRAETGQRYEISDGASLYLAEITDVEKDRVTFHIVESLEAPPIPVQLILVAALIKFDRFELMIEKATEMGVAEILPVNAARSEKGLLEAARKRVERWRRIAVESSQQARRLSPPRIADPQPLAAVLAAPEGFSYLLDEQPGAPALLSTIPPQAQRRPANTVRLLIGPEGGWTDAERAASVEGGWTPVSLGPLILRAETAAISAAALLLHAWWASQLE